MDTSISLVSPAKLNLFLHINGRRASHEQFPGYHELQTVFQLLDRGDTLSFQLEQHAGISIKPELQDVPLETNLIYRAVKALEPYRAQTRSNQDLEHFKGISILLDKNIPMGGGLGGGSSNAATTLLALNHLWRLNLNIETLAKIGAQLGADVPIFVRGHSAWAEGIGDRITPITLPESWFLILAPECHINTAKIFSNERLTRDTPKMKIAPALEGQANKTSNQQKIAFEDQTDSDFLSDHFHNDCEPLVCQLYPEVDQALNWLNQFSPSRMTGTGACCFARFDTETQAQQVLNEARSKFKGFIAKGVNLSPALQRLNEAKVRNEHSQ